MTIHPARHPAVAGLGAGLGMAALLYPLDPQLYRVLLQVPGVLLPHWLELAIHLTISVVLALLYQYLTQALRLTHWWVGIIYGALASTVYWPLAGLQPMPLLWLTIHLAWGGALGLWLQPLAIRKAP